jgi:molybdate transport system regulatory protein
MTDKTEIARHSEPVVRVFLIEPDSQRAPDDQQAFCGPGMIRLLRGIKETGSVRKACEKMEMSYSKAWKLLGILEKWLGFQVTVRHQGGKAGGEAFLTDEGERFLEKYQLFEKESQDAVQAVFERHRDSLFGNSLS